MVSIAALYGIFITALGVIGYLATGQASKTALIPCIFGLPVIALAIAAWFAPNGNKNIMLATVAIAFLAFLGTVRGFSGAIAIISGTEVERPAAVISQATMAIGSLIYMLSYFISFTKKRN